MDIFAIAALLGVCIVGGWCVWRVRHEYHTASRLSSLTVGAVWVLYVLHAGLTILVTWQSLWPLPLPKVMAWILGITPLGVGIALCIGGLLACESFRRMSGMTTDTLVQHGAYRWSRNPQNVGWGLMLAGIALLGMSAFALLVVALFWVMLHLYLPVEEAFLAQTFGDTYRRYCTAVPRYLGWPTRR